MLLIQLTSSQSLAPHKPSRPLGPAPSKTNTPHSLKQQPHSRTLLKSKHTATHTWINDRPGTSRRHTSRSSLCPSLISHPPFHPSPSRSPIPRTEKGAHTHTNPHTHTPTHPHTHTHTHTQRGEESDRISNRGLEKRMEREREVEYLQASLQAADCLRRERRSVSWGQIVPADPRRARPVHLGSLVCRALNSLFTAPLALDTSSPRPRLRHTRREHVQPGHDTRSRDVESTFASIHLHQKHQTKQQQQRTASAEQRANSKQRRAAAMTTPPHATCPSSRPSVQLSATPCAHAYHGPLFRRELSFQRERTRSLAQRPRARSRRG